MTDERLAELHIRVVPPPPQASEPEPADEPVLPEERGYEDDFSPFTMEEHDEPRGLSPLVKLLLAALLIAAVGVVVALLATLVAAGEVPIGLTTYHSNVVPLKRKGAPIDFVPVQPVETS